MPQQFTPDLVPNLSFWFEPSRASAYTDAGVTLATDGQTVQQLNDLSGNGFNASQATSANRPIYKGTDFNGQPSVQFSLNAGLSLGVPAMLENLQYCGHTLVLVAKASTIAGSQGFILSKGAGGGEAHIGLAISGSGVVGRYDQAYCPATSAVAANEVFLLEHSYEPINFTSALQGYKNQNFGRETLSLRGQVQGDHYCSYTIWEPSPSWTLGNWAGGLSIGFPGEIALALCFAGPVTAADMAKVRAYAASRYGCKLMKDVPSVISLTPPPTTLNIACTGNSLVQGQPVYLKGYPEQVAGLMPQAQVLNFGLGGTTSAQEQSPAATREDTLMSSKVPNILVFWEGTNSIALTASNAAQAYTDLAAYCTARRAAGWKVGVCTVIARSGSLLSGGQTLAGFEADRQTLNTNIRTNWATFADFLVDLGSSTAVTLNGQTVNVQALGAAGTYSDTTNYQTDGTHLQAGKIGAKGYGLVAYAVQQAILGYLVTLGTGGLLTTQDTQNLTTAIRVRPGGAL